MGKNMDDSKIYFLDFTFNPKARTLKNREKTIQLRKKQADVLILLCAKYPEPVSQKDFLAGAWGGGYVTPQSIAQVIRSLRLSLDDINKNIIVTIPKLGYQFTAKPSDEEPVMNDHLENMTSKSRMGENRTAYETCTEDGEKIIYSGLTINEASGVKKTHTPRKNFKLRKAFFYSMVVMLAVLLLHLFVAQSAPLNVGINKKFQYRELNELNIRG
ncbi:winged helix-turn-helix domain-containing protein [Erwinia pyrifoliae]|nr:transcriptional regulator [Erwinia pyrifoliae]CAX55784.1 conserved uncharacterized protein [Erwinia pyrifoliae Ep1/96]